MKFKLFNMCVILTIFIFNTIEGGCGNCQTDRKIVEVKNVEKVKVNSLVTNVPEDGDIEGLVITSCGKCNFGTKDKRCDLSVKIGEQLFSVKGTGVHDHGDAHSSQGFCSAVRVARAKGKIKKNVFHADSFVLVGN